MPWLSKLTTPSRASFSTSGHVTAGGAASSSGATNPPATSASASARRRGPYSAHGRVYIVFVVARAKSRIAPGTRKSKVSPAASIATSGACRSIARSHWNGIPPGASRYAVGK